MTKYVYVTLLNNFFWNWLWVYRNIFRKDDVFEKNCDGLRVAIFLKKGNSVGRSDVRFLITNIGIMQLIVAAYGLSIRQFFTKRKVQSDSFLYENKKRTNEIRIEVERNIELGVDFKFKSCYFYLLFCHLKRWKKVIESFLV